jgi:hypothetical protein
MTAIRRTALAVAICLGVPLISAPAAFASSTLTVTPNVVVDGQTVSFSGSGFHPSSGVGFCQAIDDGSPEQNDCGSTPGTTTASPNGDISGQITVRQTMFVPSLGRNVDCMVESCKVAAAEINDIANTAAFASLTFIRVQPDGQIRRLSDGAILGDDVYGRDGVGETATHGVAPGGAWSYAVQVQNDGERTDDITVTAGAIFVSPNIAVRYFAGWFDVTGLVNGAGFTFGAVPPGAVRRVSVQFTASPGASPGERSRQRVTFTSQAAPVSDAIVVAVRVPPT